MGASLLLVALLGASACGSGATTGSGGRLAVVAAENFWGSIAAQLGGDRVSVTSIISNPDTDPHDYEPTPKDGRRIAAAQYMIVNGVGYDPWASKLAAASGGSLRTLTVGDLVGVKPGGNPHRWYAPDDVRKVADQVTADLSALAPKEAAYFDARHQAFVTEGLSRYNALIAEIKQRYAGTPVGASESIFTPLADALGLDLVTPESFLAAISEGAEPTAADKATIDQQISGRAIKTYVFNSQNSTPDVQAQVRAAKAAGIPVTSITETLEPANATFQDWQVAQLQALEQALAQGAAH